MGKGRIEHPFSGQVRYRGGKDWVEVSSGRTLREAAGGASAAFFTPRDADGRGPVAVRVVPGAAR